MRPGPCRAVESPRELRDETVARNFWLRAHLTLLTGLDKLSVGPAKQMLRSDGGQHLDRPAAAASLSSNRWKIGRVSQLYLGGVRPRSGTGARDRIGTAS